MDSLLPCTANPYSYPFLFAYLRAGLGLEQPYVAVIADVLSLCVQWFDGVMHECLRDGTPLPNRARSAVVTELHKCVHSFEFKELCDCEVDWYLISYKPF